MSRVKLLPISNWYGVNDALRRLEDAVNDLYDGQTDYSRYEQVVIPAASFRPPGVSDPAWDSTQGAWSFTGAAANNVLHGSFMVPHSYKEGTNVKVLARVHWTSAAANQKVKWNLLYKWHNLSATISSTWVTAVANPVLSQTVNVNVRHEFSLSGGSMKMGSELKFQLQRAATDASDSYGDQVFLDALGLQFATDKPGSYYELSK